MPFRPAPMYSPRRWLLAALLGTLGLSPALQAQTTGTLQVSSSLLGKYHGYYNLLNGPRGSYNAASAPLTRTLSLRGVNTVYENGETILVKHLALLGGYGSATATNDTSRLTTDDYPALDPLKFGIVLEFNPQNTLTQPLIVGGEGTPWFQLKLVNGLLSYSFTPPGGTEVTGTLLSTALTADTWQRVAVRFDLAAGKAQISRNGGTATEVTLNTGGASASALASAFASAQKRFVSANDQTQTAFNGLLRALQVFDASTPMDLAKKSRLSSASDFVHEFAFPPLTSAIYDAAATEPLADYISLFPASGLGYASTISLADTASESVCKAFGYGSVSVQLKGTGTCKLKATQTVPTGVVTPGACTTSYNVNTHSYVTTCGSDIVQTTTLESLITLSVKAPGAQASQTGPTTAATVTGNFNPPAHVQSTPGSIFVAAILPSSLGGGVFFSSASGSWTAYTNCAAAPAYYTGTLESKTVDIVSIATDLSSLIGTKVYLGYGKAGSLSPAGTACTNMLNNGTYDLVLTIR